ncbi:hypothetical protein C8R43DRAFT_961321 [Mycena crocata]|nr:hypothetical protein C8R43DRAFT_961321 [Mycena crocata]
MSTSLSLFEELTQLNPDLTKFPVTELLAQLLLTVGHDVCLTKRNLHSSYWTVSRGRDLCDEINGLVNGAGDGESWDVFDKYTAMIPRILVDFSVLAEKESVTTKLPGADNIQAALEFIDSWRNNRKALRDTVQQLLASGYLNV